MSTGRHNSRYFLRARIDEISKLRFHRSSNFTLEYSFPLYALSLKSSVRYRRENELICNYVAPSRLFDSIRTDVISECLVRLHEPLSLFLSFSRFKSVEKACNDGVHLVNNLTSRLLLSYRPSLCRSFSVRYLTRGKKRGGFGNRGDGEGRAAVPRRLDWLTLPIVPEILQRWIKVII